MYSIVIEDDEKRIVIEKGDAGPVRSEFDKASDRFITIQEPIEMQHLLWQIGQAAGEFFEKKA